MKIVITALMCFWFFAVLSAGTDDVKSFLNEYYHSVEKYYDVTKLQYAILKNKHDIAKILLNNGADPNEYLVNKRMPTPTPLMLAVSSGDESLVEALISKKVDVNFKSITYDKSSMLPIELAVRQNQPKIILKLIAAGGVVQNTSLHHGDALVHSVSTANTEIFFCIVETSLQPFNLKAVYPLGFNLLSVSSAVRPENAKQQDSIMRIYTYLLNNRIPLETDSTNALSNFIQMGNMELVKLAINHGSNINGNQKHLHQPIFSAISYSGYYKNLPPKCRPYVADSEDSLLLLLDLKVELNFSSPLERHPQSGISPLGYAMYTKANEAARILIEHGADINYIDNSGATPLMRAVQGNNVEGVKLLLSFGADIFVKTDTAYSKAHRNLSVVDHAASLLDPEIFNILTDYEVSLLK